MLICHGYFWIDKNGDAQSGPAAVARLQAARREWSGYLDETAICRVIAENRRIESMPEAKSTVLRDSQITYGRKQGLMEIRDLLNQSYAADVRDYDYYPADSLTDCCRSLWKNTL